MKTNCQLCNDKLGRNEHLVFLALLESADKNGKVKIKGSVDKFLEDYVEKNLTFLNDTQIHYRLALPR